MYCQICANPINDELSFCNRCGSRVVKNELMTSGGDSNMSVLKSLSIATGLVGVVGLGGLIALISILVGNNVQSEVIAILSMLFAATTFSICFLMTRQITRLSGNADAERKVFKQRAAPERLNPPDAATESQTRPKSFRSVTENTTRTLDKNNV